MLHRGACQPCRACCLGVDPADDPLHDPLIEHGHQFVAFQDRKETPRRQQLFLFLQEAQQNFLIFGLVCARDDGSDRLAIQYKLIASQSGDQFLGSAFLFGFRTVHVVRRFTAGIGIRRTLCTKRRYPAFVAGVLATHSSLRL